MSTESPIILAVDDNPDSLKVLNEALSAHGYTTLVASSGQHALNILSKASPNLVLLDAMMPEMDGFETCQNIKKHYPDLPVVFMTGLSETEHIVKGLSAGGVDYLVKPLNHQELLARVKVHINNAKMANSTKLALDSTGQHMAALNNQGQVIWTTEQAQVFIDTFSSKDKMHFIDWLQAAKPDDSLEIQQGQSTLVLTYTDSTSEDSHLIKFKSHNLKLETQTLKLKLKITRREADVLIWVAKGKTDWEIAQILSISERTVNKHLEQIYRKLGVNNRTSASALAINVL
ncbi:Two-component transcriptional response regulator, LuxR family [hydrothermal vent metagenome]|uniref:Two-component transcriptional response regulator, LuxR family n=1 Tax=hydrothermal vent metagenome TaxID=652676 RepID=A0A3B0WN37_9ZZZZ